MIACSPEHEPTDFQVEAVNEAKFNLQLAPGTHKAHSEKPCPSEVCPENERGFSSDLPDAVVCSAGTPQTADTKGHANQESVT